MGNSAIENVLLFNMCINSVCFHSLCSFCLYLTNTKCACMYVTLVCVYVCVCVCTEICVRYLCQPRICFLLSLLGLFSCSYTYRCAVFILFSDFIYDACLCSDILHRFCYIFS